jgi:putative restriction endonuclease
LKSYTYQGVQVPLVDAQKGIWNPRAFNSTLSIVSMLKSKYPDEADADSLWVRCNYRDNNSGDNKKLRAAFHRHDPILYFEEVYDGHYAPRYPAYVVADDVKNETFLITFEESFRFFADPLHMTGDERRYAERVSKVRLHQPVFRARIMRAYASTCAVCSLKHPDLLDAAHIVSDSDVTGFATVNNGLALCKIHHAAYDRNLLGISPEFRVKIDAKLLDEIDGPMLRHGLQDMDGQMLVLPRQKANYPSKEALDRRYQEFAA